MIGTLIGTRVPILTSFRLDSYITTCHQRHTCADECADPKRKTMIGLSPNRLENGTFSENVPIRAVFGQCAHTNFVTPGTAT